MEKYMKPGKVVRRGMPKAEPTINNNVIGCGRVKGKAKNVATDIFSKGGGVKKSGMSGSKMVNKNPMSNGVVTYK